MAQNSDKVSVLGELKPTWRPQIPANEKITRQLFHALPSGRKKRLVQRFPRGLSGLSLTSPSCRWQGRLFDESHGCELCEGFDGFTDRL